MLRGEEYVGARESAMCDMPDRAYDGIAEPTGGVFSIAPGRADILRRLRAVASDYTRGEVKFARVQSSRAIVMFRKFDIITIWRDIASVCGVYAPERLGDIRSMRIRIG